MIIKSFYAIDSMSSYVNSNVKFIIMVYPHVVNKYSGNVTLKVNGQSYFNDVYDGKAIIIVKAPSKVGTYKVTIYYDGKDVNINSGCSTFTLKVKNYPKTTTVKAPSVTAYYKTNKYFKVTVKKGGNAVKGLKLKAKVYTGSKYKTYTIKTDKNGVAKLSTKKFKIGSHKVKISSTNKKYKISKTSKIVIKKKNSYKTITTNISPNKWITKKSGKFIVKTKIEDFTVGLRAPYKYVDIFLLKNGKEVKTSNYKIRMHVDGKWTGWKNDESDGIYTHRHCLYDKEYIDKIQVKFHA